MSTSPLQLKVFKERHNNLRVHTFLGLPRNEPNANICTDCDSDLRPEELGIDRSFSLRNGFSLILRYITPPRSVSMEHSNIQIASRLQFLMKSLTLVEESDIRQLTLIVIL